MWQSDKPYSQASTDPAPIEVAAPAEEGAYRLTLSAQHPERLASRAAEMVLYSRINYAHRRLKEYMASGQTWAATHAGVLGSKPVAYFSAEFGMHESIPIYSGGLGVLSGDHVKSCSDLGIPFIALGLFYDQVRVELAICAVGGGLFLLGRWLQGRHGH